MNAKQDSLIVGAAEANQRFSRLLSESEGGREVVITRRGHPVARITAITEEASAGDDDDAIGRPAGADLPDYSKRVQLIETCRRMNAVGINQGTSGNASVRIDGGLLITPSGLDYDLTTPADIVRLDPEGKPMGGRRNPSSEWLFHVRIMQAKPRVGAVLHTHSLNATTLACLGRSIPPFHYMVAVCGGRDIRCAPYATFGTEKLAETVIEALDGRLACLMANHGMIVLGRDLKDAFNRAVEVENLAAQYLKALAVGTPQLLTVGDMDVVLEKFKNYSAWAEPKR